MICSDFATRVDSNIPRDFFRVDYGSRDIANKKARKIIDARTFESGKLLKKNTTFTARIRPLYNVIFYASRSIGKALILVSGPLSS